MRLFQKKATNKMTDAALDQLLTEAYDARLAAAQAFPPGEGAPVRALGRMRGSRIRHRPRKKSPSRNPSPSVPSPPAPPAGGPPRRPPSSWSSSAPAAGSCTAPSASAPGLPIFPIRKAISRCLMRAVSGLNRNTAMPPSWAARRSTFWTTRRPNTTASTICSRWKPTTGSSARSWMAP